VKIGKEERSERFGANGGKRNALSPGEKKKKGSGDGPQRGEKREREREEKKEGKEKKGSGIRFFNFEVGPDFL
jgi:hypothetical protein